MPTTAELPGMVQQIQRRTDNGGLGQALQTEQWEGEEGRSPFAGRKVGRADTRQLPKKPG